MERQEESDALKSSSVDIESSGSKIPDETTQSENKADDEVQFLQLQDNLLVPLNLPSLKRDELVDSLRNEVKLLKGRLKGFESLASLYKQSKLLNSQLQKECEEQRILLEQHQTNGPSQLLSTENPAVISHGERDVTRNDLSMNSDASSEKADKHSDSFEIVDVPVSDQNKTSSPVEIPRPLRNETSENSIRQNEEFDKTEEADDRVERTNSEDSLKFPAISLVNSESSGEGCCIMESERQCLKRNENNSELFEIMELRAFWRHLKDSRASSESKSFLMELLAVGMKVVNLDRQISNEEEENHDSVSQLGASRLRRQIACFSKPDASVQVLTEDESTQTQSVASNTGLNVERKSSAQVGGLPIQMSSSDARYFANEVQILQAQVMTFKDDFEQERRDREKMRSKYDSLKKHFDRLTAEHIDLKQKNRLREVQHKAAKKETVALGHCAAAQKPNTFQPSSNLLLPNSRTRLSSPKWTCKRCTFENHHVRNICDMCSLDRSCSKNRAK